MIFFGSNDSLKYFFDTEHQLESIFGDFQFKSAKPYDSGSMASDNFPAPNLLPCERIWQRWKRNDPIFSLFFDNRWKKIVSGNETLFGFLFLFVVKKNRRCNEMFFCFCNVAKAKKIDNIERNTFQCCNDSAATLPSNKNLIMMVKKKTHPLLFAGFEAGFWFFELQDFFRN